MKIAILSDVHGNLAALQTVTDHIEAWGPDAVLVNGDVVNRGPDSRRCWDLVAAKRETAGWQINRGNHEDYVLKHTRPEPDPEHQGIQAEINRNSRWTCAQLDGRMQELAALPDTAVFTAPDGSELHAWHASVRGNQDGIFLGSGDGVVRAQIAPAPAVFVTSHIHFAYTRRLDETLIVNTGSAGQHCYGDTRASYAQVVWRNGVWRAEIIRLPYDMAATERAYFDSGFMEETGPMAQLIFREWKTAVPLLPAWRSQYFQAVLSGEIELEASVQAFLAVNNGK